MLWKISLDGRWNRSITERAQFLSTPNCATINTLRGYLFNLCSFLKSGHNINFNLNIFIRTKRQIKRWIYFQSMETIK